MRSQLKDELRELRRQELSVLQLEIEAVKLGLDKQQRRLKQLETQAAELNGDNEVWVEKKLTALEREHQIEVPAQKKKPVKAKQKPGTEVKTDSKAETPKEKL